MHKLISEIAAHDTLTYGSDTPLPVKQIFNLANSWIADAKAITSDKNRTKSAVRTLAAKMIERATALGYKGKKADNAALDFFLGGYAIAEAFGDKELAEHISRVAVMLVAVRGMLAVRELANT